MFATECISRYELSTGDKQLPQVSLEAQDDIKYLGQNHEKNSCNLQSDNHLTRSEVEYDLSFVRKTK